MMSGSVRDRPRDPVIHMDGRIRDFTVTLLCGLRVVGHDRAGDWSVSVYADGRLLGHGSGGTRLHALEQAGVSSDDAGEVLGRSGI